MTKNNDTLEKIKKTALVVQKEANTIIIKTHIDLENAATLLAKVREYLKLIDARRMEIARPIQESLKKLKEDYDNSKKPYLQADDKLAGMIKVYRDKEAEIIRKKQEKELEQQRIQFEKEQADKLKELEIERENLTKKEAKEIEKEIKDEEFIPEEPTIVQEKTIRSDTAKLTIRKTWEFKIIDEKKVPREYLKIDEVKIGQMIRGKEKIRKIEGVKIYQIESI